MKWIGWTLTILIVSGAIFAGGFFSATFLTGKLEKAMQQVSEDLIIAKGQCAEELGLDKKNLDQAEFIALKPHEEMSYQEYKMLICLSKKLESKGIEVKIN